MIPWRRKWQPIPVGYSSWGWQSPILCHSHGLQHTRLPCPSLSPGVCSNSCLLSQWCCLTVSSSAAVFSSCPQSFPASGSFPMSQLFASDSQNTRASASPTVFPMNIQGWFPLGLIGLISLLSNRLSRVFSSTTIQRKHQFFGTQPSLWSNFHTYMTARKTTYMYLCICVCVCVSNLFLRP